MEEGIQCNEFKKRFHTMCTRLSLTAYKICSKRNPRRLCTFCRLNKTLLIQQTVSLLVLTSEKFDKCCTGSMGTDNKDCVSVMGDVTVCARHPIMQYAIVIYFPKQLMSDALLDIDGQVATIVTDNPDKTIIVPSSFDVDVLTDEKWMKCRKDSQK